MAYAGYLIKVLKKDNSGTDYTIPMQYIREGTYEMTYSVLDRDSTRNAKGKLKRTALPHKVAHCTIQTRELNNTQLSSIMSSIQARYTKKKEKKVKLSVYIPEVDDYVEDYFYLPDIKITINHIEPNNVIKYNPVDIEFIGY